MIPPSLPILGRNQNYPQTIEHIFYNTPNNSNEWQ
uniref:Uncharacterized protein n=1 Tax=Anguilla anguilla TaxID=7936 RepID=A0A0E9UHM4_ANGAN